ncbi:hypothetical protein JZ751_009646 [Albula glossodonta]|uniref:Maturin n=1 Tax=Albula glossodonta TaxID=121402 RepID=A0A8T2NXQ2_9TELE|nr:hypothetical protein JZ751_009646 [Albula glossodonta]
MEFKHLADIAEKWCSGNPFDLIAAEEADERRESEDCLPFLQLAQDYISSCGKKTLLEILNKVLRSFRPLLGLPETDDDACPEYHANMEEEPEADHQQMGVSQ